MCYVCLTENTMGNLALALSILNHFVFLVIQQNGSAQAVHVCQLFWIIEEDKVEIWQLLYCPNS